MRLRRKPKPEPWWGQSIQGPWLPVLWESGPTGTVLELEDPITFLRRCWIDGETMPHPLPTVRIIEYPRSWWRRLLLRLAGVL